MEEIKSMRAFYRDAVEVNKTVFYQASKRIKDENGEPAFWELKVLTYDEIKAVLDKRTRTVPNKITGKGEKETDTAQAFIDLAVKAVVFPNLNDAELQDSWGVVGADALLKAMLTAGELADLIEAVNAAAGYKSELADKIKTVKN